MKLPVTLIPGYPLLPDAAVA